MRAGAAGVASSTNTRSDVQLPMSKLCRRTGFERFKGHAGNARCLGAVSYAVTQVHETTRSGSRSATHHDGKKRLSGRFYLARLRKLRSKEEGFERFKRHAGKNRCLRSVLYAVTQVYATTRNGSCSATRHDGKTRSSGRLHLARLRKLRSEDQGFERFKPVQMRNQKDTVRKHLARSAGAGTLNLAGHQEVKQRK